MAYNTNMLSTLSNSNNSPPVVRVVVICTTDEQRIRDPFLRVVDSLRRVCILCGLRRLLYPRRDSRPQALARLEFHFQCLAHCLDRYSPAQLCRGPWVQPSRTYHSVSKSCSSFPAVVSSPFILSTS